MKKLNILLLSALTAVSGSALAMGGSQRAPLGTGPLKVNGMWLHS